MNSWRSWSRNFVLINVEENIGLSNQELFYASEKRNLYGNLYMYIILKGSPIQKFSVYLIYRKYPIHRKKL